MSTNQNSRPSNYADLYRTSVRDLKKVLVARGLPTDDMRVIDFSENNKLPIWYDGSIVAHQVGEVVVAHLGDGIFVGLRRGSLDAIAGFRVDAASDVLRK